MEWKRAMERERRWRRWRLTVYVIGYVVVVLPAACMVGAIFGLALMP